MGAVPYADRGYIAGNRHPLGTWAQALAAYEHFRDPANQTAYTDRQLHRIGERIRDALTGRRATPMAKITGTMIRPGVSRNGRLYTKELIAKGVARAQERIAAGNAPITMLTHHDAEDDSTRIVGHLTSLTLAEDGSAKYEAAMADTGAARDIVSLADGKHLKGVSIRGRWLGDVRTEHTDEGDAVTADDIEFDGLDFTKSPGVIGANIETVSESASRGDIREIRETVTATLIESVAEPPRLIEDDTPPAKKPTGVTQAIKNTFLADVRKETPTAIASGMRRLSQWAATGAYPRGTTYADLRWFYNACAAELKRRDPKSTAGGHFPPQKGS